MLSNSVSWMRVKSFWHGQLKGHLLRGSEINKDLVIAALTIAHQQPTLYHDFSCLHFYTIMLIFWYELVLLGRRVANRKFTISAVEVTTSIVL